MKITALCLTALVSASHAFAPSTPSSASSSARALSTESTSDVPLLQIKEKVPCFGAAPFIGDNDVFFGENYWDKLTMEYGSAETGQYLRAAELKHGRAAMLAVVGFALQKLGVTFDKISPHEYLSVTQNVKFADLAAMGPLQAVQAVPLEGYAQVFAAIAAVEIYELTHRDGELKRDESVAPGLQPGGLTGDLGWNPLDIKITEDRRLKEIQNGRAAMFAICAWVAAEAVPGSVPLPLPW
uniref:Uncharacterized protein n=1 Tax=Phaeodactylum tricornutum TaxID=2850 RepID=A0A8J9X8U2_PHATR